MSMVSWRRSGILPNGACRCEFEVPIVLIPEHKTVRTRRKLGGSVGITYVTVKVSDFAKQGTPYEAEFLVDTGAVDSMAPRDKLIQTGIKPEGKANYELADGKKVEFEFGYARLAFAGKETVVAIVFGPTN